MLRDIPAGYSLKSMTSGSINLAVQRLTLQAATGPQSIGITLEYARQDEGNPAGVQGR